MRFAAVNAPKQQPPQQPRTSAVEVIRRIVAGQPSTLALAAQVRLQDLPTELDQRVRLIGEW